MYFVMSLLFGKDYSCASHLFAVFDALKCSDYMSRAVVVCSRDLVSYPVDFAKLNFVRINWNFLIDSTVILNMFPKKSFQCIFEILRSLTPPRLTNTKEDQVTGLHCVSIHICCSSLL